MIHVYPVNDVAPHKVDSDGSDCWCDPDIEAGNSLPPPLGSACGRWSWRVACIKSHIALRYGIHVVDETHGGQAQHYGWPKRSVGVEWSWKRNTWFAGFEFWPNIR